MAQLISVNSYEAAQRILGNRDRAKLGYVTYLERRGNETIAVRQHQTDVVTYRPDRVILNTGGWRTPTTKDRLNQCSPAQVWSEKGIWYCSFPGVTGDVVFEDGITFDRATRQVTGAGRVQDIRRLRKQVKEFAAEYVRKLFAGELPAPGGGDCWYCHFVEDGPSGRQRPIRRADHILSHLEEQYYVPSLILRALQHAGAGDAWYWSLPWNEAKPPIAQTSAEQMYRRWLTKWLHLSLGI